MNTSFEVGARLVVEDLLSPKISELIRQFDTLDASVKSVQASLRDLVPQGLAQRFNTLAGGLDKFGTSATGAADAIAAAMAKIDKSFGGLTATEERMQTQFSRTMGNLRGEARRASDSINDSLSSSFAGMGPAERALGRNFSTTMTGIETRATEAGTAIGRNLSSGVEASLAGASAKIEAEMAALSAKSVIPAVAPASPAISAVDRVEAVGGGLGSNGGGTRTPNSGKGFGRARGGSGGGTGGDDVHFSRYSAPIPGGHVSVGGNAAIAAAGVVGYALIEEAKIEDILKRAAMTGQLPLVGNVTDTVQGKALRDVIQKGAASTGFAPTEVGEAILGTERQFGGLTFDKRLEVLDRLLPYAGFEARMKETSLKESFEAMVGLMHMSGTFKPEELPELARAFSFTSMITPVNLGTFGRALSYSMPSLHGGLEMDPSSIMFLTAMMETAGVTNTKSGTWLRSFFEKSEPDVQIPGMDLTKTQKQHNEALRQLGLIDAQGKVTWQEMGADGKIDWNKSVVDLAKNLGERLKAIPVAERLELEHRAFGTQGMGFANILALPQFVEQLPVIAEKMRQFKGGGDALDDYAKGSPVQQARETWRDTQNILMDIGTVVLPPLNLALRDLDEALKKIQSGDWTLKGLNKEFWDHAIQPDLDALTNIGKDIGEHFSRYFTELETDFEVRFVNPVIGLFDKLSDAIHNVLSWIPGLGPAGPTEFHADGIREGTEHARYINRQTGLDLAGVPAWAREEFGPPMPKQHGATGSWDDKIDPNVGQPHDSFWKWIEGNLNPVGPAHAAEAPLTPGYDPLASIRAPIAPAFHPADDDRATRAKVFDDYEQQLENSIQQFGSLDGQTGALKATFASFKVDLEALGLAKSTDPIMLAVEQGVLRGLTDFANGGRLGDKTDLGGSGGITNASYETWDGPSGAGGFTGLPKHHDLPSVRYGRPHEWGPGHGRSGEGFRPSAGDQDFKNITDSSGLDWRHMGVQMNRKRAYLGQHLEEIGASRFAAAGMLGNSNAESNFKTDAFNPRLEKSHGLFQWNEAAGRWGPVLKWAKEHGRNAFDPLAQLDFAKLEASHMGMRDPRDHRSVWEAMQQAHSVREASDIWLHNFEKPKVEDRGNRGALSEQAFRAMDAAGHSRSASRPDFIPPPRPHTPTPIHTQIHLDGRIVAENTMHHVMDRHEFTGSHSLHDDHAHYAPPDTAFG